MDGRISSYHYTLATLVLSRKSIYHSFCSSMANADSLTSHPRISQPILLLFFLFKNSNALLTVLNLHVLRKMSFLILRLNKTLKKLVSLFLSVTVTKLVIKLSIFNYVRVSTLLVKLELWLKSKLMVKVVSEIRDLHFDITKLEIF